MNVVEKLTKQVAALRQHGEESVDLVEALLQLSEDQTLSNTLESARLAHEALEISRKLNYRHGEGYSLALIGYADYALGHFESALKHLDQSLQIVLAAGRKEGEARIYSILAMVHRSLGNFDKAFSYALKSLKIFESLPQNLMHAWILNSLGGIYNDLQDYDRALQYHKESLHYFEILTETAPDNDEFYVGRARALTGLGAVYQSRGEFRAALPYQEQALELYRRYGNDLGESRALNDLGVIYQELGEFETAREHHLAALAIRERIDARLAIAGTLIDLGRLYLRTNRFPEALEVLDQAVEQSTALKAKQRMYLSHQLLARTHEELGDHRAALQHFRAFHELQQQVYSSEANARVKNLQVSLEVETAERMAAMERDKNRELQEKNEQLEQLLEELSSTQSQLVQSEKMAALGSLVAGVVHEINTPLGVMTSATDIIKRCVTALDAASLNGSRADDRTNLLINTLVENQRSLESALARLNALMRSLKTFSRLDEATFQHADIHEGINSALQLIEPEVEGRIVVEKDYNDLPPIPHYPGELNQVFMNLLRNAVESIRDNGKISIKTRGDDGKVCISISDSGQGIPAAQLEHLFEPSFSKKGSRIKAGLGLFAAYNIVKKHRGEIKVASQIGLGTTVTIEIPMDLNPPR